MVNNNKRQSTRKETGTAGSATSTSGETAQAAQNGAFSATEMPKSFLEAWLLLMLKTWGGHGYALSEDLSRMGIFGIDHTRIYRQLRELEKRGFLLSSWNTASFGPAKRVYQVTEAGEQFLASWAQTLQSYNKMMQAFTSMYAGAFSTPAAWRSQARSAGPQEKATQKES